MNAIAYVSETHAVRGALLRLQANLAQDTLSHGWPRGVIGAYGPDHEIQYGYPEIAGYWLRWASQSAEVSAACGAAVVAWLEARGDEAEGWPTRVSPLSRPLHATYHQAQYLFDHCMLWDGLQRWGQVRGDVRAAGLAAEVWRHLQTFAQASGQGSLALLAGRGAVPRRWSGRVGPFLLKVCARVNGQQGPLAEACAQATPELIAQALAAPHAQAHPQLYAIEGMLELGYADEACDALGALIEAHGGLLGLRESASHGPMRCDVLAQALRAAHLCGLAGRLGADMESLALNLAQRVDSRGRVPFAQGHEAAAFPTWAALFTEQALRAWLGQPLEAKDIV